MTPEIPAGQSGKSLEAAVPPADQDIRHIAGAAWTWHLGQLDATHVPIEGAGGVVCREAQCGEGAEGMTTGGGEEFSPQTVPLRRTQKVECKEEFREFSSVLGIGLRTHLHETQTFYQENAAIRLGKLTAPLLLADLERTGVYFRVGQQATKCLVPRLNVKGCDGIDIGKSGWAQRGNPSHKSGGRFPKVTG